MSNIPLLYKPKELCSIFGVSVKTVYAMLYRQQIPGAFQIGKSWYINREVLLKDLEKKSFSNLRPLGKSQDPNSGLHGIT